MSEEEKGVAPALEPAYTIVPQNAKEQIERARQMIELNSELLESVLKQGTDYATLPKTDKPTLLKAGAEVLCKVYGLAVTEQKVIARTENWGEGIFCYTTTCTLTHIDSGRVVASGMGAANSRERKYHLIRGKENQHPADNINTLIKMASKRAFVDAALKATCTSRIFTQDLEGMPGPHNSGNDYAGNGGGEQGASGAQLGRIAKITNRDMAHIESVWGVRADSLDGLNLTKKDASELIDILEGKKPPRTNKQNAGYQNAGYQNAGYQNPGYQNAGYQNPGYQNAGYQPQEECGSPGDESRGHQPSGCAGCGIVITQTEAEFSQRNFGRQLCRRCQQNQQNQQYGGYGT